MHSFSINASSGTRTLQKYENRVCRLQTHTMKVSLHVVCVWRRHAAAMSVEREIHSLSSLATAGKMTLFKLCNFHLRKMVDFGFFFFFSF